MRHFRNRVRTLCGSLAELLWRIGFRDVLAGDDRDDAGYRHCRARVHAANARVRHRAQQQLREQHALGAEVFGVLRTPGDFRDEIVQLIRLPDVFVLLGISATAYVLRRYSAPRMNAFRILL